MISLEKVISFFRKKSFKSQKQNFFEAICILLPIYSFFCFILMITSESLYEVSSFNELLLTYCLFVFIVPGIISSYHSFIYSLVLQLFKIKNTKNTNSISFTKKTDYTNLLDTNDCTTYQKNELKLNQLFKKE